MTLARILSTSTGSRGGRQRLALVASRVAPISSRPSPCFRSRLPSVDVDLRAEAPRRVSDGSSMFRKRSCRPPAPVDAAGRTGKDPAWKRLEARHQEASRVRPREIYAWQRRFCARPMEAERSELSQLMCEIDKLFRLVTEGADPATIQARRKALKGRIDGLRQALGLPARKPPAKGPKAAGPGGKPVPGGETAKNASPAGQAGPAVRGGKRAKEAGPAGDGRRRWWTLG